MQKVLARTVVALAAFLLLGSVASATTFSFTCVSNNSGICPTLATQLTVTVTPVGTNQISFTFTNAGPIASSITDLYWENGGGILASFATTFPVSTTGIYLDSPATPSNLPGSGTLSPTFVASFSADSSKAPGNPPPCKNLPDCGVNPGESVTIIFNLASTASAQDVINAMNGNTLRVGIHVQAIGTTGQSDSLVTTPNTPVPEPASMLLMGTGLLGLAGLKRKFFRS